MTDIEYTGSTTENEALKPVSKAAWKKAAVHTIRCLSGEYVKIKIPDLALLVETGQIPQNLIDVALKTLSGQQPEPSVELIAQQREFQDCLVRLTVVEPKLDDSDMPDVPFEDKELISSIAMRERDFDAEGSHIAGLDKSEKFRRFRRIGEFTPTVEGL